MSSFIKNLREGISGIKPKDLIYPGITLLFIVVVGIIFFVASGFIAKNINIAFSGDTGNETSSLNLTNYTLVAKKLGINTEAQKVNTPAPTSGSTELPIDKTAITITVKNSTTKKGIATALAIAFEDAGFKKPQTGNEPKAYATTTILVAEDKKDYQSLLLEIVHKMYPDAVALTSAEVDLATAVVIIGAK